MAWRVCSAAWYGASSLREVPGLPEQPAISDQCRCGGCSPPRVGRLAASASALSFRFARLWPVLGRPRLLWTGKLSARKIHFALQLTQIGVSFDRILGTMHFSKRFGCLFCRQRHTLGF